MPHSHIDQSRRRQRIARLWNLRLLQDCVRVCFLDFLEELPAAPANSLSIRERAGVRAAAAIDAFIPCWLDALSRYALRLTLTVSHWERGRSNARSAGSQNGSAPQSVFGTSQTPNAEHSAWAGDGSGGWFSPAVQSRIIWACLALGIAARAVRFLLRFPLWEDECFLAVNFIDSSYLDLLKPLNYHQVAPLAFLWIELSAVKLFGFSEWSLRLWPFACSIGSLLLFRRLAGRLLSGLPLVLAVAVFAMAYSGVRYAAEAKPYGPDQFVALALLALAVEWRRSPHQLRWLWLLAAVTPVALACLIRRCSWPVV